MNETPKDKHLSDAESAAAERYALDAMPSPQRARRHSRRAIERAGWCVHCKARRCACDRPPPGYGEG